MKKTFNTLAIVTASLLSITSAKAVPTVPVPDAIINLVEPTTEGGSDWSFTSSGLTSVTSTKEKEHVIVTGTAGKKLPGDQDNDADATIHWGLLMEGAIGTPNGNIVSDILKLSIKNGQTGNDTADVSFEMWSDTADGFAAALLQAVAANAPKVAETGAAQEVVAGFLVNDHSGKLQINVTSDLEGPGVPPESVPDGGATALLLGGGVSTLAFLRRKLS